MNKCNDCKYFFKHFNDNGECRINPPHVKGFPEIYKEDWCGKFEAKKSLTESNEKQKKPQEELREVLEKIKEETNITLKIMGFNEDDIEKIKREMVDILNKSKK